MRLAAIGALLLAQTMWAEDGGWSHTYRMRGEVRLLLFWVGRDGVGGGRISARRTEGPEGKRAEEVEVVFGSEPARVPGGVNRWGHARERAEWENSRLVRTVFDGLMRHTASGTSAGVLADNRREKARGEFEYKALHGEVGREGAAAEIRVFFDAREFHYRTPEPLVKRYQTEVAPRTPDQRSLLDRGRYGEPAGFLGGVRALVGQVIERKAARPAMTVVHNAALYRVTVKDVAWAGETAAMRFECLNVARRKTTEFTLAVPSSGPLAGVPVRIEYQPNWWLRVRLEVER